jgi:hypothetical protein
MLFNKRNYERQLLFGFTDLKFDKNGWIETPKLLDYEIIEFKIKEQSISGNTVSFGRGLNGKWSYGITYSTGNSGGAASASIWSIIVDSKEEAIIQGLEELIKYHNVQRERLYKKDSCGNYNENYSRTIVKLIQDKLDEMTGKNAVQLCLF